MTEKANRQHTEALYEINQAVLQNEFPWDKQVFAAIKTVVGSTTASHTIQSKTHSLLSLIRTHIDPALIHWQKESELPMEWRFSEIVQLDYRNAFDTLSAFGMQGRTSDWFESDKIARMADLLIFFLNFCAVHSSETISKAYLDPKRRQSRDEIPERIGKGLKIGARSDGKQLKVPTHLSGKRDTLLKLGLCQACGDLTAAQIEFEAVIDHESKIDDSVKVKIAEGIEFSSKTKGSKYFCPAHSERDGGSNNYKKGRAQVDLFLSLLLAVTYNGVGRYMNELFPYEFDLLFAKKAIRCTACKPELDNIAHKLSLLGNGRLMKEDSDQAKVDILQSIHRMFHDHLKLTPMPKMQTTVSTVTSSSKA